MGLTNQIDGKRLIFIQSRSDRPTVTGIKDWTNDSSGKRMQKTKVGRATTKIRALYSSKVGGLANYISYNPWIENGEQVKDEVTKELLTLQDKYERQFNLPKGYLTNRMLKKGEKPTPENLTYFQTKGWKLHDGSTVFDLSTLDGLMGYYVALESKYVANSEKELRGHKWPKSEFYIAHANESDEIRYKKNHRKGKLIASLYSEDMTDSLKRKFTNILNLSTTHASLTTEQVENLLFDTINSSNHSPGSNLDKLDELFKLLNTPDGREKIEAKHLLKEAVDSRVIHEKQDTYTWVRPSGSIELGVTYSEAIDFLLNPKKQALIEDLEEEIKLKSA